MSGQPEIVGTHLTHVRIRPCGHVVELGFKDGSGNPVTLALPHQALGMLLMTLPRLIEMSLRQRTGDASLRQVYPVGDWRVETASDNESLLLSLATPDGFAVSFCLPLDDAQRLGQVLADLTPPSAPAAPNPPLAQLSALDPERSNPATTPTNGSVAGVREMLYCEQP